MAILTGMIAMRTGIATGNGGSANEGKQGSASATGAGTNGGNASCDIGIAANGLTIQVRTSVSSTAAKLGLLLARSIPYERNVGAVQSFQQTCPNL
jgi:hypothetical protein